jgi:hypothetical protein
MNFRKVEMYLCRFNCKELADPGFSDPTVSLHVIKTPLSIDSVCVKTLKSQEEKRKLQMREKSV